MSGWRDRWTVAGPPPHSPIPPPEHPSFDLQAAIRAALEEDSAGIGDITTLSTWIFRHLAKRVQGDFLAAQGWSACRVDPDTQAVGTFLAKADGVLAGLSVAEAVFAAVDPGLHVEWSGRDGGPVSGGTRFGSVRGGAQALLVAERVALNFLQRMSGIATATAAMTDAIQGTGARIMDTRKTTPGLRVLDKWAMQMGGGSNHRLGLFDMILIKDNHVTAAGGITAAVQRCQEFMSRQQLSLPVEVETRTLPEVEELMALVDGGGAPAVTRIMLDNMAAADTTRPGGVDVSVLSTAVARVGGRLETEASGNVTLATVAEIAKTGVNFISCGALTHSVTALDISLKIALL